MLISYIKSPCLDCPDRHRACHDSCEKFKDFHERYMAEKQRIEQEKRLKNQIDKLNYDSAKKSRKDRGSLQHGYKPKRR